MIYPQIYSMSTVGVLKHYNQDYLMHPVRTDFTGSNGIGKSIIADLLQMIFIFDPKVIKFGTDGLKKENRQPHKLAFEKHEVYAFLNIEMYESHFITIGVCITNKKNHQLIPFAIINHTDLEQPIKYLVFTKEQLLFNKHFIKNNAFLTIEDLSKHIRDTHGLTLKYFSYKKNKNLYYDFLFKKRVLPINLTIDENLKAFAKIIQSFSKARSLDVSNSNSLKNFLFEDSKREQQSAFNEQKVKFEELVINIGQTDKYIEDLKKKQKSLTTLKKKENQKIEAEKKWAKAEVVHFFQMKNKAETALEKSQETLTKNEKRKLELEVKQLDYKQLVEQTEQLKNELKIAVDNLKKYQQCLEKYEALIAENKQIKNADAPIITELIDDNVNIMDFDTKEIVRRINAFKPIYAKYGSIAAMYTKVEEQEQILKDYENTINQQIGQTKEIIELLSLKKDETLFTQVLDEGSVISEAQETILFHLLNVHWTKPEIVNKGIRYTQTLDILTEDRITKDEKNEGYWLNVGDIHEFVPYRTEQRLFDNKDNLKQAITNRKEELEIKVNDLEQVLRDITMFKKTGDYDPNKLILPNEYALDSDLRSYDKVNDYEKSAGIIQSLDQKIKQLDDDVNERMDELENCKKNISFEFNQNQLSKSIQQFEEDWKAATTKWNDSTKEQGEINGELKGLINTVIPQNQETVENKTDAFNKAKLDFIEKKTFFQRDFPNVKIDLSVKVSENELEQFRVDKNKKKEDYITQYKSTLEQFEETKEGQNQEINLEVAKNVYNFSLLEQVLLGEIKYTDKIAEKIEEANQNRENIADNIYAAMLNIFKHTTGRYRKYNETVNNLNTFFKAKERRINDKYYLEISFNKHPKRDINKLKQLQSEASFTFPKEQSGLGGSVETLIEKVVRERLGIEDNKVSFSNLLDPKYYFDLNIELVDEDGNKSESTGQTYAALILLGIARLSDVEGGKKDKNKQRPGIRFIILEEMASLDQTNFETFPNMAEKFGYQIITMTPQPYRSASDKDGWYVHDLLPNPKDEFVNINYHPCSYFKTNYGPNIDLQQYLKRQ